MARHNRRRRRRDVFHRFQKRTPSTHSGLLKLMPDPVCEVSAKDFARKRQYTLLNKKPNGVEMFFKREQNYKIHELAQKHYRERYIAGLLVLNFNGHKLNNDALFFGLAAALAHHDKAFSEALLNCRKFITPKLVLKALSTLDMGRRIRAIDKRVKRLQFSQVKIPKRQVPNEASIQFLKKVKPQNGSATNAVCKQIRRWSRTLSVTELQSYLRIDEDTSENSFKVWKLLADICHFNPRKDFPAYPEFLTRIFEDNELPEEESAPKEELKALTVNERVMEEDIPLKDIRDERLMLCLTPASKARLATYTSLDELFCHFQEVLCPETDTIIADRLEAVGDQMWMEDGLPLLSSLLAHITDVVMVTSKMEKGLGDGVILLRMNENEEFVPVIDESKVNLGQETLRVLEQLLEKRLITLRERIKDAAKPELIIVDQLNYKDVDIGPSSILDAASLAMISGAELVYDIPKRETAPPPQTAAEIISLGKSFCDVRCKPHFITQYLEELYESRRKVNTIVLVLEETNVLGAGDEDYRQVIQRMIASLKMYQKDVSPDLFVLLLSYPGFEPSVVVTELRRTDLNCLIYERNPDHFHTSRTMLEALDVILRLMTSPHTSLKSIDGQTNDIAQALRCKGVKPLFDSMVK